MATSFTYATLKAALVAFTTEDGADFDADVDTIIALAEDKVLRDLDLELFDKTDAGVFTPTNPWLVKPTDLITLRTMHVTDATGNLQLMEPRSWAFCKDYWPKETDTIAVPKYYSEFSETAWLIVGTPSLASVVTVRFIRRPTGLSSGNPTTWLGTNVGDLLFYACLVCSEQYLKADDRVAGWKTDYEDRLQSARSELKPETRADYMPVTVIPTKEA